MSMQILSQMEKDDDDENLVGFFLFAENAFYPFLRKGKIVNFSFPGKSQGLERVATV